MSKEKKKRSNEEHFKIIETLITIDKIQHPAPRRLAAEAANKKWDLGLDIEQI